MYDSSVTSGTASAAGRFVFLVDEVVPLLQILIQGHELALNSHGRV